MSMLGTDALAVACILTGAALSGGVTLATMEARLPHRAHCAVEAVAVAPNVVVSGKDGVRTIVVRPDVRVQSAHGCAMEAVDRVRVRVRTDLQKEIQAKVQAERERAQAEIARAQAEMERAGVDQARVQAEMERAQAGIERALREVGGGGGRP